jgi:hypothetical protein
MNIVKSVPDIGLEPILIKHIVAQNAMEVGSFARPFGNLRSSLIKEEVSQLSDLFFWVTEEDHAYMYHPRKPRLPTLDLMRRRHGIYSTRHVVRNYVVWKDFKEDMSSRNLS